MNLGDAMGWFGFVTNLYGNLALTKKDANGWIVRLVANAGWIGYSWHATTTPLLANHIAFGLVNILGWYSWKLEVRVTKIPTSGGLEPRPGTKIVIDGQEMTVLRTHRDGFIEVLLVPTAWDLPALWYWRAVFWWRMRRRYGLVRW